MKPFSAEMLMNFLHRLGGPQMFNSFVELVNKIGAKAAAEKIHMKPSQLSRYLMAFGSHPWIPSPEVREFVNLMLDYEKEQNHVAQKRETAILRLGTELPRTGEERDESG